MTQLALFKPAPQPGKLELNEAATRAKTDLLAKAATVKVTDPASRDLAAEISASIKKHLNEVEADREAFKAPFCQFGKQIDAAAKEHSSPLSAEYSRLNSECGAFNEAARRRAQQEEDERRRQAEEIARKQREAEELAAKLAADAIAAAKASSKPDIAAELETQEREETLARERKALAEGKARLEAAAAQQRAALALDKPSGGTQRIELDITVDNAALLFEKYPMCVKLVPDLNLIKAMIKAGQKLPGVTVTERAVFVPRTK